MLENPRIRPVLAYVMRQSQSGRCGKPAGKAERSASDRNPQRPYAGHPACRVMRWSHLHGDMQGRCLCKEGTSAQLYVSKAFSEIPCRVSSDLHEWRNDLDAVSTRGSVKLKSR